MNMETVNAVRKKMKRAFLLLASDALDNNPQAQTNASGHNAVNPRLSLSQNM